MRGAEYDFAVVYDECIARYQTRKENTSIVENMEKMRLPSSIYVAYKMREIQFHCVTCVTTKTDPLMRERSGARDDSTRELGDT